MPHPAKHQITVRLVSILLCALGALAACAPGALADSPAITLSSGVPANVLYGNAATVSMSAANPAGQPTGYNLSFRDVLPNGVSYVSGSSNAGGQDIEPQVIENAPSVGETTLIWSNISDLSPSSQAKLTYEVAHSTSTYAVGDDYTEQQSAYVNTNPRYVPQFDSSGNPISGADSYTAQASASASTTISAIQITGADAAGAELLRGVQTHQTLYTLTVTNNDVAQTTDPVLDAYLPAGLEYLGCGQDDNTTDAPTNPGSGEEWPGSGSFAQRNPAPEGCQAPSLVQTVTSAPGQPAGVYTHVRYQLSNLAAGQVLKLRFLAGIPIRENTMTWPESGAPAPGSGQQGANLDNNSGPETYDGQSLPTYASVAGDYDGSTPVSDNTTVTLVAKDAIITKSVNKGEIAIGDTDTWTLDISVGEYRYVKDLQVSDAMPDGTCPLDSGFQDNGPAQCSPPTGQDPSFPYQSIAENADGSWTETWTKSTDPALAQLGPNTSTSITIPVLVRSHYQSEGADTTPILAGDSWSAPVTLQSSDYVRCGSPANADCSDGGAEIDHDMADDTTITDGSSASQSAAQPQIAKSIDDRTSTPVNCLTDNYVTSTPVYDSGDVVCYKLHIDFPAGVYTGQAGITDFLPPGTTYNEGSWQATTQNTVSVDSVDATSNPGVLSVALGDQSGPSEGYVEPGQTLDAVYAVTIIDPSAAGQYDVKGNLMKFANVNSAGESFPQRAAANYQFSKALLSLTEGIYQVNGEPVDGNPPNTDDLRADGGDNVTVRVDVTNSGGLDATDAEVWDDLPSQLSCAATSAISDAGSCDESSQTIRWSGVEIHAGQTKTLYYTYTIPAGSYAAQTFADHAGVVDYQSEDDSDSGFANIPASNIDPNVDLQYGAPNTSAADDPTDVYLGTPALALSDTTSVSEPGNDVSQVTVGERIDYTATIKIPQGVTEGDTATFEADLPTGQLSYVQGSAQASLDGNPIPGDWVLNADGDSVTLDLPAGYSPPDGDDTVTVTWFATVSDAAVNERGDAIAQAASFSYNAGADGTVQAQSNTVSNTVVEPNLAASLSSNAVGCASHPSSCVAPGQTLTYTATLSDPSGLDVSSANDPSAVVSVPAGETPVNAGTPVQDGGTVGGTGAGVWNQSARTITFSPADQILPGDERTFTYTLTVDSPQVSSTTFTDTLQSTASSLPDSASDPEGAPRDASSASTLGLSYYAAAANSSVTVADATLTKAVSAPSATIGDPETYTVNLAIPANVSLNDALVSDTLPDGVSYDGLVSALCTAGCQSETDIPVTEIPDSLAAGKTTVGYWLGEVPAAESARTLTIIYSAHVLNTYHNGSLVDSGQTLSNSALSEDDLTQQFDSAPDSVPPSSDFTYNSPSASATITVTEPTITITKTVADSSGTLSPYVQPGDSLTYTLKVKNTGTSTAYDVPLSDVPNAHIVALGNYGGTGAGDLTQAWSAGAPTSTWYIPSLAKNTTLTFTYTAALAPSTELTNGEIDTNTATVGSFWGASDAQRAANPSFTYREYNSASSTPANIHHVTPASASLTVALPVLAVANKTGSGCSPSVTGAEVNQQFQWCASATNTSPAARADGVTITDQLPANWTYTPGSAGAYGNPTITDTAGGELLTWPDVGQINAAQSISIKFQAQPTLAAEQTPGWGPSHLNTSVESATYAQDNGGYSASAAGAYGASPSDASGQLNIPVLSITKTPKGGSFTAGATGDWSIVITNSGLAPATDVQVQDDLPAADAYAEATATASPSTGFSESDYQASGSGTDVTWTIASLAAGQSVTITVPSTPAASLASGTQLVNSASAQASEAPTPVSDSGSVTIATDADMAASDSASPTQVSAGSEVYYTLSAVNNGPSDAQSVTLSDTLSGAESFSAFTYNGSHCTVSGQTVSCTWASIPAGGSEQVVLAATLASSATGIVPNTVNVSSATADPNLQNNEADAPIDAQQSADLGIVKSAAPSTVLQGAQVTYTLQATNYGPSDAPSTTITDTLPAGQAFVSASPGCTDDAGTVTCTQGTLPAGQSHQYSVVVAANQAGLQTNTASISSPASDPNPANNSSSAQISVSPVADVALTKTAPASVAPGADLTYTITTANNGPSPASGVSFTDALPAGESFQSINSPAGWSCATPPVGQGGALSCEHVGAYADGASDVFSLVVAVDFSLTDENVTNSASITANESDPNLQNNTQSATTAVSRAADLSLTKSASPSIVNQGQDITYTLSATDNGPDTATHASITDTLPDGVAFKSASAGCTNDAGTVTCELGSIAPGYSAGATITATAQQVGTLTNTASVSADQPDPNLQNNSASASVTVEPTADLQLSKTAPASVEDGQNLTYTLTAANNGPSPATGVSFTDALPAGESFQSINAPAGWSCATPALGQGGTVNCEHAGAYADGASDTFSLVVAVGFSLADQDVTNTASISAGEYDPDAANNSASTSTQVSPAADMAITKVVDKETPNQQREVTYTLTYANNGPDSAHHVSVTDTLPAGVSFLSSDDPGCAAADGVVSCTEGTLAANASGIIHVIVTAQQTGAQHNVAEVSADEPDPNLANNSASADINVGPSADLTLTKTTSTPSVAADSTATYTLQVHNAGPSDAHNVVISDPLPAGESFIDASVDQGGSCADDAGTLTCTVPVLDVGQSASATLDVTAGFALAGSTVTNTATVSASEDDTNPPSDLSSSVPVTVGPAADVSVLKLAPASTPAGADLAYTLEVQNAGPQAASDVTLTDTLPSAETFLSASPPQGSCQASGQTVTCQLGTIPSGAGVQVPLAVNVALSAQGQTLQNTASVSANQPDPNPANNSSTARTLVGAPSVAPGNLVVLKRADREQTMLGQPLGYTITATNNSLSPASGVVLADQPSANAKLLSVTSTQGACEGLRCALGTLAAGQTVTMRVVLEPLAPGPLLNGASAISNQGAGAPASLHSQVLVAVQTKTTRLTLSKHAQSSHVLAGQKLRYTLLVTNAGSQAAASVQVCDAPAAQMLFTSTPGARFTDGRACWSIAMLGAHQSRRFTVTVRFVSSASGRLLNRAFASARNAPSVRAQAPVSIQAPVPSRGEGVTG